MRGLKITLILATFSFLLGWGAVALAEPQGVVLLEPSLVKQPENAPIVSVEEYLAKAYPIFLGLAAFLAVMMIAWGGMEYILSNIPGAKGEGKKRIEQALWGLLLILAAWLILETINPSITKTIDNGLPGSNQQL